MKKSFALIFFLACILGLTAQEEPEQNPAEQEQVLIKPSISKITFSGLKKTSNSYIQSKVQKFIGKTITDEELHDLETTIQLEGIFNEIKIEPEPVSESETQINITVTEKITFIPVPFAMYSNSNYLAGAIVMDTNALGRKDMFIIGGFFAKNARTGLASLASQPKDNWVPGISIFVLGSMFSPEYSNSSEENVLKYKDSYYDLKFALSEKFADNFTAAAGLGYTAHSISEHNEFEGMAPESIKIGSFSFTLGYSKSDWNGVFMSTNSAAVKSEFGLSNSEYSDYKHPMGFSFDIAEQHPVFTDRLRFYQKYSGYYGKNLHISALKGAGSASVSILSGHFNSSRLVGGHMGLEFSVKKFNWGMISIYGDYQCVYAKDFEPLTRDGSYEFMHGASGGTKFYLAKIAFPALALGLSYNVSKRYWQYAFALGATF